MNYPGGPRLGDPRPAEESKGFVNQRGDYTYLREGYYLSEDAEVDSGIVYPTTQEALDAYVAPITMMKASRAGIPVPDYFLTNEYIPVPALMYSANPYMRRHALVLKDRKAKSIARSLTRNFKYVMLGQKWSDRYSLKEINVILDRTPNSEYDEFAARLWSVFHIPIARVRLILDPDRGPLLSAIYKLPLYALRRKELQLLQRAEQWQI